MSRLPIPHFINQIKTKLGFDRTLTASGEDVVDAVNKQSQQIANVATVITSTTNNSGHAISSGEYFIANGAKYRASATIDTGATWLDKSTSVSDHDLINALNSNITSINSKIANVFIKRFGLDSSHNAINITITKFDQTFLVVGRGAINGDKPIMRVIAVSNGNDIISHDATGNTQTPTISNGVVTFKIATWNTGIIISADNFTVAEVNA